MKITRYGRLIGSLWFIVFFSLAARKPVNMAVHIGVRSISGKVRSASYIVKDVFVHFQ